MSILVGRVASTAPISKPTFTAEAEPTFTPNGDVVLRFTSGGDYRNSDWVVTIPFREFNDLHRRATEAWLDAQAVKR